MAPMTTTAYVCVHDPEKKLPPGYLFKNERELAFGEARGCIALPVDDDLLPMRSLRPLDGFNQRFWGDGWVIDKGAGERACPMLIRVLPQRPFIWWAARIVSTTSQLPPTGRVRLVTDSSDPTYSSAGVSPVITPDLLDYARPGKDGVIIGVSQASVSTEALMALTLHAVTRRARVLWTAVSLCSQGVGR